MKIDKNTNNARNAEDHVKNELQKKKDIANVWFENNKKNNADKKNDRYSRNVRNRSFKSNKNRY